MKENLLLKKILLKIFNRISADNNYLKIESIHFKNNYLRIEGNENSLQCEKQSFLRNSHVYIKGMENRISIDIETEVYGNNMQVLFVNGSNNQILIGKNCVIRDTTFFINGNNNVICLENNVSVYGAEFHIEQDNNCLITNIFYPNQYFLLLPLQDSPQLYNSLYDIQLYILIPLLLLYVAQ